VHLSPFPFIHHSNISLIHRMTVTVVSSRHRINSLQRKIQSHPVNPSRRKPYLIYQIDSADLEPVGKVAKTIINDASGIGLKYLRQFESCVAHELGSSVFDLDCAECNASQCRLILTCRRRSGCSSYAETHGEDHQHGYFGPDCILPDEGYAEDGEGGYREVKGDWGSVWLSLGMEIV